MFLAANPSATPPIRKALHLSYPLSDAFYPEYQIQLNPLSAKNTHYITGHHRATVALRGLKGSTVLQKCFNPYSAMDAILSPVIVGFNIISTERVKLSFDIKH